MQICIPTLNKPRLLVLLMVKVPCDYSYSLSTIVCGLECYCREFINGVSSPPIPGCRSNNTCVVSDTSIGQCFVERRTQKESRHYLLKYGCLEVQADGISVENALAGLCNVTTAKGLTVSRCCVQENLCNKHIDIPEPTILSSSTTETPPSGKYTEASYATFNH
jgi:hypothetical protein